MQNFLWENQILNLEIKSLLLDEQTRFTVYMKQPRQLYSSTFQYIARLQVLLHVRNRR